MKLTMDEYGHLNWIYERLINKYGEDPQLDYMVKFCDFLERHDPTPNQGETFENSTTTQNDFPKPGELYEVGKQEIPICPTCKKILPNEIVMQAQHYQEHIIEFYHKIDEMMNKFTKG